MVSPEDAHFLRERAWSAAENKKKKTVYARSTYTKLHREIMAAPHDLLVDHHNGIGIDNRRPNLRNSTTIENSRNSKSHRDSNSKYKGVCWIAPSERWRAQICVNGLRTVLGDYEEEIEAARAYDAAALKLFGEYAKRNFA